MASYAFRVEGIEPVDDPVWRLMDQGVRQAFWRAVVDFTLEAKDRELAAGLDRFGEDLIPIAPSTRKRGRWRSYTGHGSAGNPPLTPALGQSRTRALLTGRALKNAAEFYWLFDPVSGRPWGQTLGWHRAGAGGLPKRDVIGLAPQSFAAVKNQADAWWKKYKATHPVFEHEKVQLKTLKATAKIPLTGRTDLEKATFGVGATEEMIRKSIAAGTSTGFRQLPPRSKAGLKPERITSGGPKLTRVKAGAEAKAAAEAKARADAAAEAARKAAQAAQEAARAAARVQAEAAARAAAEAKRAAQAEEGTLTRAEIQSAIRGLKPSHQNVAIAKLIRERQTAEAVPVLTHGMTTPEAMHSVELEGIRFHYPPLTEGFGIDPKTGRFDPILNEIRHFIESPPLAPEIAKHTSNVYFTIQGNKRDEYWEKVYNTPGFVSTATGGDGNIVVYNNNMMGMGSFAHEAGHNLAKGVYGHTTPPGGSAYQAAIDSGEPPVSEYARHNPAEDFAEAVRLYYLERAGLAQKAPKRYAALEDLIHGPTA